MTVLEKTGPAIQEKTKQRKKKDYTGISVSNLISVQGGSRDYWLQETALLFQATCKTMAGFLPSTPDFAETNVC